MHEARCELCVVADVVEEHFCGFVHRSVEASIADRLNVGNVGRGHKLLEVSESLALGKGVDELVSIARSFTLPRAILRNEIRSSNCFLAIGRLE